MSSTLHELALAWSGWAGPRALQFGAAAIALLAADRWLLHRVWPRLRLALHSILLLGLVVPGSIAAPWSAGALLRSRDAAAGAAAMATRDAVPPAVAAWSPLLAIAFVTWAVIAGLLMAGAIVAHRRARARLCAQDSGVPPALHARIDALARALGLRRAPGIVVVASLEGPAVLGCRRPLLALPAALAASDDAAALEHALVHELLHVRRGDLWFAAATRVVAALWWFHPLAWRIARCAGTLRELCCDDDAVRWLDGRATEYRATLLEHARRLVAGAPREDRPLAGALGFFAAQSSILARLEWLSRPRTRRPRIERGATWFAAAALALGAWPTAAPERTREPAPHSIADSDAASRVAALDVVRASLGPNRPAGCLRLQNAVAYLRSISSTN